MEEKPKLTPRQSQVLTLAGKGYTDKAIAGELNITVHGVNFLWPQIFRNLGTHSRTAAYAMSLSLLNPVDLRERYLSSNV
jgi:DNA-binding NarL/FixJ family response regulator